MSATRRWCNGGCPSTRSTPSFTSRPRPSSPPPTRPTDRTTIFPTARRRRRWLRVPYEASKAAADLIARSYWHAYELPVAVTRFANLYGGGDANRSRLIPEAVAAELAGRAPVIRSDGSPQRDYLYVEDAVAAYLAIAAALDGDGARGEAFNAGTGEPRSVLEVVSLVCGAAGSDVAPDVRGVGVPPGEIDRQYVDAAKLRTLTGWVPEVTLEDGLARTVAWYREYPGLLAG